MLHLYHNDNLSALYFVGCWLLIIAIIRLHLHNHTILGFDIKLSIF